MSVLDGVRKKIEDRLPQMNMNHLREGFVAWWNGMDRPEGADEETEEDLDHTAPQVAKPKSAPAPEPTAAELFKLRLMIAEGLWGAGCVGPGDADYVMELTNQFGLTKEHSVCFIGAGLAGSARGITKETGAWITAFEPIDEIIAAAREQCALAGLAKRVVITEFDPATADIPEHKFQVVMSLDRLYAVEDKGGILDKIANGMADDGNLLITDYVVPETPAPGRVEKWFDPYWGTPHLATAQEYIETMEAMGLDLRVKKDITSEYAKMINDVMPKWKDLIDLAQEEQVGGVARATYARLLADEAGIWSNRLEALSKGELQVYRFLAIKMG